MKKIIFSFVLSFIFILPSSTLARETRQEVRQEVRQEAKATITQVREERKAKLTEIKQKRIQTLFDAIKNNLIKRHEALIKIKNKIEARINNNPMSKDTATTKTELAKFTDAESKYQTDLASLNTKFEELKTSSTPADLIKNLKDSVNLVRSDLDAIKKILKATINALAQAPKLSVTPTP